jgi:hypothetical protein
MMQKIMRIRGILLLKMLISTALITAPPAMQKPIGNKYTPA